MVFKNFSPSFSIHFCLSRSFRPGTGSCWTARVGRTRILTAGRNLNSKRTKSSFYVLASAFRTPQLYLFRSYTYQQIKIMTAIFTNISINRHFISLLLIFYALSFWDSKIISPTLHPISLAITGHFATRRKNIGPVAEEIDS